MIRLKERKKVVEGKGEIMREEEIERGKQKRERL